MVFTLVVIAFTCLPTATANPIHSPFPDVNFKAFNSFVRENFGNQISLATVLTMVFTLTNNPDLLNLHAHQQHPKVSGEIRQSNSAWIKALAHALEIRLGNDTDSLFQSTEQKSHLSDGEVTTSIAIKLGGLSKVLNLHPYDNTGKFIGKLNPISEQNIAPVHVICPMTMECETITCQSHAIHKQTRDCDIPKATLIKGTKIYENVPVLTGQCTQCKTGYYADHERYLNDDNNWMKLYLNSAKYLKVGQNIWVDRTFSGAVLNGTYNFHASVAAFAQFWNTSFWLTQQTSS
jgi:hypothetical protein